MKVLIWCCGFEKRFAGPYLAAEAKRQGYEVRVTGSRARPQQMLKTLYEYNPDIVFCFALRPNFGPYYEMIRRHGAKLVLWYPDMTESRRDRMWRRTLNNVADVLIFSIKETADRYKELASTVLWMPQYFDHHFCFGPELKPPKRLDPTKPIYDVCFIGSCDPLRNRWLDYIEKQYPSVYFSRNGIKQRCEIRGIDMANVYAQSKIAINIQRQAFLNSGPFVTSNRIYNAMGSGAFYINHKVERLDLVFEEGVEMVSHDDTIRGLCDKIDYYLKHEELREKIAKRGQENILRFHTLEQRMQEYWSVMQAIVDGRAGEIPAGAFGEWLKS